MITIVAAFLNIVLSWILCLNAQIPIHWLPTYLRIPICSIVMLKPHPSPHHRVSESVEVSPCWPEIFPKLRPPLHLYLLGQIELVYQHSSPLQISDADWFLPQDFWRSPGTQLSWHCKHWTLVHTHGQPAMSFVVQPHDVLHPRGSIWWGCCDRLPDPNLPGWLDQRALKDCKTWWDWIEGWRVKIGWVKCFIDYSIGIENTFKEKSVTDLTDGEVIRLGWDLCQNTRVSCWQLVR